MFELWYQLSSLLLLFAVGTTVGVLIAEGILKLLRWHQLKKTAMRALIEEAYEYEAMCSRCGTVWRSTAPVPSSCCMQRLQYWLHTI